MIIAASVVDLPEPVAPTIRIRPRLSMTRSLSMSGRPELVELRHVGGDVAQHHRPGSRAGRRRHAEAAEARLGNREVDLQLALEVFDLLGGHQRRSAACAHRLGRQDLLVDRVDLPFDLDLDRRVGA